MSLIHVCKILRLLSQAYRILALTQSLATAGVWRVFNGFERKVGKGLCFSMVSQFVKSPSERCGCLIQSIEYFPCVFFLLRKFLLVPTGCLLY